MLPGQGKLVRLTGGPYFVNSPGARVKGYDSYPEVYGYHNPVWVEPGLGVVVEEMGNMVRILRGEKVLWVEGYFVENVVVD